MKQVLLAGIFLLNVFGISAQKVLVLDITSLQPISGVKVMVNNEQIRLTDTKGEFDLKGLKPETLFLMHPDFHTVTLTMKDLESDAFLVYLNPKTTRLNEVVISSSRFEEKREDSPYQIDVISSRDLRQMNAQSSADVLMQTGNVLVQKSQMGGGSPVIRGFEANKVLIVIDGIRLNNAIYRGGHLQSVLRMDNNMLDRLEVVFGPGSTVYGSDALGGVMHFHTRKPLFSSDSTLRVDGDAFLRYASANNENTVHATVNAGGKKWAWLLSATWSDFGDLRQGNIRNPYYGDVWKKIYYADRINNQDTMLRNPDPNLQLGSGYMQYNIMQKLAFRPRKNHLHTLSFHYTTTSDVNRYDRLSEISNGRPVYAEWYYGPEKLLIGAYHFLSTEQTKLYDQLRIAASFQESEESRHNRRFNNNNRREQFEKINVGTINIDMSKDVKRSEFRYGAEFSYNTVSSRAHSFNIISTERLPEVTRYPDGGSEMIWGAAYFSHNWELSEKLIITDGIRFTSTYLQANFSDTALIGLPFTSAEQQNNALTGNIGMIWKLKDSWRFVLFGSTGFRSPNIDDLGKVFESAKGEQLVVPNPDLKPEYTYNADLTLEKYFDDKVRISATGFYTHVANIITLQPFTLNGSDSVLYDGILTPVVANQNSETGFITGAGLNFTSDVTEMLSITGTFNYTYGRFKTDSSYYPLDHIPPVFGKVSFILHMKRFRNEFYVNYNGWKRLNDYNLVGEDNIKYATPLGMPGWYTLNFRTSYQLNSGLSLQAGIENILDQNYRVFGSGISAPGRNLLVTIRTNF